MAAKVNASAQFRAVFSESVSHEKSKRGLGNRFHAAVITLLNENPNATAEELVVLFRETVTEVENALMGEVTEAFGEDATVKDLSAWTQYKSNYKKALEMVDRWDIMKCSGPYQLSMKLQEVRKALKEKEDGGAATDERADNGAAGEGGDTGSAGGKASYLDNIPASARPFVEEALNTLSKLDDSDAAEVALRFRDAASTRLRKFGFAKKKVGAAAGNGNGNKVAANH